MFPDRYFPAELESHPLHYAALRGERQQVEDFLATAGNNPYEPIQNGATALHVALAEGQLEVAAILIEQMRRDFELVGDYLVRKCGVDPEDKFWTNKSILVAVEEDQCASVKQWESSAENAEEGVLVLLKYPIAGEHVAVLNPNAHDRLEYLRLIKRIFWNGFVSWNSTSASGYCETLLALAAHHGHAGILETLITLGADLTVTNRHKQSPFHAACKSSKHEIIELLLTKYIDQFDPLALDEDYHHGLHYILYKKNKQSFSFALESLINYHMNRYGNLESEAFNSIFKLENIHWPNTSVWSQLNSAFWRDILENVCEKYEYDLSYQWAEVTVLLDIISFRKLKKYHGSAIRKNHKLLHVSSSDGFTALHALVSANELKLIKELYKQNSIEMAEIFEVDAAFATLTCIMQHEYIEMMEFILEKHNKFFLDNLKEVQKQISEWTATYRDVFPVLEKHLPQIAPFTSSKRAEREEFSCEARDEFEAVYSMLVNDFSITKAAIQATGKSLDDYNNINRGSCFLHQAIEDDHLELVEQLLEARVDVDFVDVDECHAIHRVRSIEMLQLLVQKHPDGSSLVHRKNREGSSLLHMLCYVNCVSDRHSLILELLKLGAKVDERRNSGSTVLNFIHDETLFKFLTEGLKSEGFAGIDVNLKDANGNTALLSHLKHHQTTISSILLETAESFVCFNDSGESCLAYLTRFDADLFNYVYKPILEANSDKTKEMFEAEWLHSREQASRVFVQACMKSNVFCMEQMIDMDLDFNVRSSTGWTALLTLLDQNDPSSYSFVERLLDKPIDLNLQTDDGCDALLMLGRSFHLIGDVSYGISIAKRMLDQGAQTDHVDRDGNSILHYACKHVQLDLMEVLMESNANFTITNRDGKLPYELAPKDVSEIFKIFK